MLHFLLILIFPIIFSKEIKSHGKLSDVVIVTPWTGCTKNNTICSPIPGENVFICVDAFECYNYTFSLINEYKNKDPWINWRFAPDSYNNITQNVNLLNFKTENYQNLTIQMGIYRGCWNDETSTCRELIGSRKKLCHDANTCWDLAFQLMGEYGNNIDNWIKLTLAK